MGFCVAQLDAQSLMHIFIKVFEQHFTGVVHPRLDQALGYMIGKLKIAELRDRARARLGERFDLRRFHNAVIDQGALPLDTLARVIDEWIAAELAR